MVDNNSIILLLVGALFCYMVYYGYSYYFNRDHRITESVTLIDKPEIFSENYSQIISRNDIFPPNIDFSISWKMKILNIPSNYLWASSFHNDKLIFRNGDCMDVFYNPANNLLKFKFNLIDSTNTNFIKEITLKDIPLQSWFQIYVVIESRYINLYMNKKLVKSYKLPTIPMLPKGDFQLGQVDKNFLGKIDEMVYHNYSVPMLEILNIT